MMNRYLLPVQTNRCHHLEEPLIVSFNVKDATKSEIIWALHSVHTNTSVNSNKDITAGLKRMFPDSKIDVSTWCRIICLGMLIVNVLHLAVTNIFQ